MQPLFPFTFRLLKRERRRSLVRPVNVRHQLVMLRHKVNHVTAQFWRCNVRVLSESLRIGIIAEGQRGQTWRHIYLEQTRGEGGVRVYPPPLRQRCVLATHVLVRVCVQIRKNHYKTPCHRTRCSNENVLHLLLCEGSYIAELSPAACGAPGASARPPPGR